jgi:L,D-peptidoglycan transpeptidase YkuD (ErfK/YbiS/YcfS/YnhG family)
MNMRSLFFALIVASSLCQVANALEVDPETFGNSLQGSSQVIVVIPTEGIHANTYAYDLDASQKWVLAYGPFRSNLGRKGFAAPNEKKEGDGKTPSGIYPVGFSFGYAKTLDTKLEYRQSTADDFWVDDKKSPEYNQWVHGKPNADSFEKMLRSDVLYSQGFVVEYNVAPIVKGAGSAIFFHIRRAEEKPTAGCVAMDEANLSALLHWLDSGRSPKVILNPESLRKLELK